MANIQTPIQKATEDVCGLWFKTLEQLSPGVESFPLEIIKRTIILVTIDGQSGSGKSTFATAIRAQLSEKFSFYFQTEKSSSPADDLSEQSDLSSLPFAKDRSGQSKISTKEKAFNKLSQPAVVLLELEQYVNGWNSLEESMQKFSSALKQLLTEGEAVFQRYDWEQECQYPEFFSFFSKGATDKKSNDIPVNVKKTCFLPSSIVLLLEGSGSGSVRQKIIDCMPVSTYGIWVEANPKIRKERAIRRDAYDWQEIWSIWEKQELELLEKFHAQKNAQLQVNT